MSWFFDPELATWHKFNDEGGAACGQKLPPDVFAHNHPRGEAFANQCEECLLSLEVTKPEPEPALFVEQVESPSGLEESSSGLEEG